MVAGTINLKGERYVILRESEYDRLLMRGKAAHETDLPPLPKPRADGNFDAVAYSRASLARKLIRDRRAAGLSQAELARLSGIRVETLNRIERVKLTPTVATVDKIDRALVKAARRVQRRA